MKKGDIAIIIIVFILATALGYIVSINKEQMTSSVIIVRDGVLLNRYKIDKNYEKIFEINIDGEKNKIEIKDGKVRMIEANCHDGLCVKSRPIFQSGEMIVCLPHKLYIKIEGENLANKDEIDVVVN
ncbi:MAG: NusG domain II-containing protein [Proteocatella sp.]